VSSASSPPSAPYHRHYKRRRRWPRTVSPLKRTTVLLRTTLKRCEAQQPVPNSPQSGRCCSSKTAATTNQAAERQQKNCAVANAGDFNNCNGLPTMNPSECSSGLLKYDAQATLLPSPMHPHHLQHYHRQYHKRAPLGKDCRLQRDRLTDRLTEYRPILLSEYGIGRAATQRECLHPLGSEKPIRSWQQQPSKVHLPFQAHLAVTDQSTRLSRHCVSCKKPEQCLAH
jgi:hypothetical protein